jgi:hypothetical protein
MRIRLATSSDAASIAHIHVITWRAAYRGQIPDAILDGLDVARRTSFWQERLSKGDAQVFVGEDNATISGFCDLVPSRDKDADPAIVAEIAAIYVLQNIGAKARVARFAPELWPKRVRENVVPSPYGYWRRIPVQDVSTKRWALSSMV